MPLFTMLEMDLFVAVGAERGQFAELAFGGGLAVEGVAQPVDVAPGEHIGHEAEAVLGEVALGGFEVARQGWQAEGVRAGRSWVREHSPFAGVRRAPGEVAWT